jgi:hypothetical protein
MPGWLLFLVFALSLALVVHGWGLILSLAFELEKRRHGWPDDEALQKFVALRRPRGRQGDRRMRQYIREDLRDFAEETGQGARHSRARLSLAAGYAGAIASGFAWIIGQVF